MTDLLGQVLDGQLRVERQLGAGGMGAVFLATQLGMARQVVVKVMHPELTVGCGRAVERFQREARAVASLNHPHIVQLHQFGQAPGGFLFQAMEFIDGRDLGAELTAGPLPVARALHIVRQVAEALSEAHAAGIVHRDLKPENIMLSERHGDPDWVTLLDFGIAKLHGRDEVDGEALTQAGAVFGTPAYMAPEQIRDLGVDGRTDLYALGVLLHEMLTGRHPFGATSPIDYLVKHANEAFTPISVRYPTLPVPPAVDAMVTRLLAKAPEDRYPDAHSLIASLESILAGADNTDTPVAGLKDTGPAGAVKAGRARRGGAIVGLAVLVAAGIALAVALSGRDDTPGAWPVAPAPVLAESPTTATLEEGRLSSGDALDPEAPQAETAAEVIPTLPESHEELPLADGDAPSAEDFEHEGFIAPFGSELLRASRQGLRIAVPLPPAEILAFYEERLGEEVTPIRNGLRFTDRRAPWASFTIGVEDAAIVLDVRRRVASRPAATAEVRMDAAASETRDALPAPDPQPEATHRNAGGFVTPVEERVHAPVRRPIGRPTRGEPVRDEIIQPQRTHGSSRLIPPAEHGAPSAR